MGLGSGIVELLALGFDFGLKIFGGGRRHGVYDLIDKGLLYRWWLSDSSFVTMAGQIENAHLGERSLFKLFGKEDCGSLCLMLTLVSFDPVELSLVSFLTNSYVIGFRLQIFVASSLRQP